MSLDYVLNMKDIDKSFPGVHALKNVSFDLKKGEVHVLMGENGAGKSTLIKVLGGIYIADSGDIYIDGQKVNITKVDDSQALGVRIIHQELSLAKNMTIAENIFMNNEATSGALKFVNFKEMNKKAQKILDDMNLNLRAGTVVGTLSIAQQQMVEIARALSSKSKIIVMDEPTATLTEKEVNSLFEKIRELKKKGVGIIYISHRMAETFEIGDRVTVMRDGQYIGTKLVSETDNADLIRMMVGRKIDPIDASKKPVGREKLLDVKGLTNNYIKDINFTLKKGEILGFSGLVGSGRTEVARAIFGVDPVYSGEVYLEGEKTKIKCPKDAINYGISLVPEDRKGAGLVLIQSVSFNITISVLKEFVKNLRVNKKRETEIVDKYGHSLSIKTPSNAQLVMNLSGGNQQKVVISKWLATNPKVLILDEPTRGIDVGAKAEIYNLMNKLVSEGISIIMISSDLPEIINMSSRVVVMNEGRIAKIIDSQEEELTQEKIMNYATGGLKNGN